MSDETEIEVTPAMLEAGERVMAWWDSDEFEAYFDKYAGPLTSTRVFLRCVFQAMAEA